MLQRYPAFKSLDINFPRCKKRVCFIQNPTNVSCMILIVSGKNMIIFQPYHVICLAVLYIASGAILFSSPNHWLSYKKSALTISHCWMKLIHCKYGVSLLAKLLRSLLIHCRTTDFIDLQMNVHIVKVVGNSDFIPKVKLFLGQQQPAMVTQPLLPMYSTHLTSSPS